MKFTTLYRGSLTALLLGALALTGCTKKVDATDTTISWALKANIKGLDPAHAQDMYSGTVMGNIYEGLMQYNYLKRPHVVEPALADGMPTVSKDGLTHTFKIKKGVKFQDNAAFPDGKGREVTAQDFVYSFKRLADPKVVSEGFWIFDGKIKGLNEWAEATKTGKATYDTPVEGLQAPDKNTLVIKLTQPYFQLNYVLAMQYASVVPKEAIEKYGAEYLNNPVGTGPYMLAKPGDFIRGSKIVLTKNPNFRPETYPSEGEPGDKEKGLLADAGKPLPFADKLVFNELPEDQPRWQNWAKGHHEFVEIPNDNYDTAVKDGKVAPELAKKKAQLEIVPRPEITYIAFNMKDPIVGKNKALRHALTLAHNDQAFIQKFYNGRAMDAQTPIPPGLDSYDPNFKNPYSYNMEQAKKVLKDAGHEGGKGLPELMIETPSDSKQRQMAEHFVQTAASIGIKVKISANTWPQHLEKIKKGKAQIFQIAWGADYPDAQNFYQLFYSKNMSPGPNDSAYSNPEFDKLYERSLAMGPSPARDKIYHQMRDIVVADAPWIFVSHRQMYNVYHGWLHNFKWSDINSNYFKYLRVDPKARADMKAKL